MTLQLPQQTTLGLDPASSSISTNIRRANKGAKLVDAAGILLPVLEQGIPITAPVLRSAMTSVFGATDAEGAWVWKDAYEACESAVVLFLKKHLAQMHKSAATPDALLSMLSRLSALLPTHTRRSDDSTLYQQFSTPLDLAYVAALAADITAADLVLEPSAGTGMLAIHAQAAGASLTLNELAVTRADILATVFSGVSISRFNAEQIDDYLPRSVVPSVVLMNPPFSAKAHVAGTVRGTDMFHLTSALRRLAPGGRLVAITSENCTPANPDYADAIAKITPFSRIVFSAALNDRFFRAHGTSIATRLTVIDKVADAKAESAVFQDDVRDAAHLLALIKTHCPPRPSMVTTSETPSALPATKAFFTAKPKARPAPASAVSKQCNSSVPITELAYEVVNDSARGPVSSDQLYERYSLDTIRIPGAGPHRSNLVQSAAMASVRLPAPTYRPHLPEHLITDHILSDAQLESVIYAGEAHSQYLAGRWLLNESYDVLNPATDADPNAVQFRRGWMLGDGTGVGKGRQVAAIILDNWLKGRKRALWLSKNDELLEDAQRDWGDLGQERLQLVLQGKYALGTPIALDEGILFTTYATLRSAGVNGKQSRLDQLIAWLGRDFDGVIIFDESHAMGNAAPGLSARGKVAASLQGLAGLRLQNALPHARVVYTSATGATEVENLAYTARLGLWGSADFPFKTRPEFIDAMHAGGIAAMEVLARDAKALGLYTARNLSYEGVEIDFLEHALTPEQINIYNEFADAFQVIHQNLNDALEATNITSAESGTLNRQAKSAARSAFESNKQRFFNHLITAMKMPSLIKAIEADLERGDAPVIQLVTTSEALMERRLALIPPSEWSDLNVDITPREYVIEYLRSGFPTQLFETFTDEGGKTQSRPVLIDGNPVICREAERLRDAMIENLSALPPVQSALDQLVQHFGTDMVAEITGRSRRIVRRVGAGGRSVLAVENRSSKANLAETEAFMDDRKRILVFSEAGGTGRSYHASLTAKNQRRRIHYILEPGWKADAAIQGLGRTNRTNQASAPLCRPVTTDIRGEKRFLSTIARRLDTLGAITKGQRQTGGQGLFRPEDNLESPYARSALAHFYHKLAQGQVTACSLDDFEQATGLSLLDADGSIREQLPPIHTFLNRLLALRIDLQNALFAEFDAIMAGIIEDAIAAGTFERGLETISAESLDIISRRTVEAHPSGAETLLFEVERKDRTEPISLERAIGLAHMEGASVVHNTNSGRSGVLLKTTTRTNEDGSVTQRYRILHPLETDYLTDTELKLSAWKFCDQSVFEALWSAELDKIPQYKTSRFYIVTGLLLPVWKRLPQDFCRIYRFTTNSGERVIGRPIEGSDLGQLGLEPVFASSEEAYHHLLRGGDINLTGGLCLKRVMAMHARRIELTGFDRRALPGLKAMGLMTETVAYTLRVFVPLGEAAPALLSKLFKEYPPQTETKSGSSSE
jgi:predicted RNA methylase